MSVEEALAGYAAGRVTAQQLVGVVVAAYYGNGGRGTRDGLRPIVEVIERAHPGVVELASVPDKPGFAVRLAERPFPKKYEAELRTAVSSALNGEIPRPASPTPAPTRRPGLLARILRAIRRVFSA
ncbi:MAG TPA: hypothetical protein VFM23_10070 [Gemmatimonadales bacterium]|nr:hypothetical protein [Gemmatimonadales bacterium]